MIDTKNYNSHVAVLSKTTCMVKCIGAKFVNMLATLTLASALVSVPSSVFVRILTSTRLSVLLLLSREILVKREIKDTLESQACRGTLELLAERAIQG